MKIKNTLSRNKIIRFADAFIEVPAKAEWLAITRTGVVYATQMAPYVTNLGAVASYDSDPIELSGSAIMVANVEDFGGAQVIKISDLMDGL